MSQRAENVAREAVAPAVPAQDTGIAAIVERGLLASPKTLPPYLFYDEEGSRLFEEITRLDEYYPTRVERSILEQHARDIVDAALVGASQPLSVVELGAGTATKSELLLRAVVDRQNDCLFVPVDVSASAVDEAIARLAVTSPQVRVLPLLVDHFASLPQIRLLGPRRLVMFLGSSVGNFEDDDAVALLSGVASVLSPGDAFLMGTDLRKDPAMLVPAYDDARGVTAAFNLNVLARLNRELGATFDLARFAHVALWNDEASRIEMHLESTCDQQVEIPAIGRTVTFRAGERIHTESSIKYDDARVDSILTRSGFVRERTWTDPERLFAVHLARLS